jgi:hypothetical protein
MVSNGDCAAAFLPSFRSCSVLLVLGSKVEKVWSVAVMMCCGQLVCDARAQEIVFFEQGEPMVDGDTGDLKV